MIDLTREAGISLPAVARLPEVQIDGRGPSPVTVHRWALRGCRGILLETVKRGHVRVTSRAAVRRFLAALSNTQPLADDSDAKAASEELQAMGIA